MSDTGFAMLRAGFLLAISNGSTIFARHAHRRDRRRLALRLNYR